MAVEAPAVADRQAASVGGMLAVVILIAITIVVRLIPVGDTGMCPEEPTLATAQPVAELGLCTEHSEFLMGVEIIPSGVIEGKVNGVVLTPADLYGGVGDSQAQGNSVGFYR